MSKVMEGISEQIVCPHWFRGGGIVGCTAGMLSPCSKCNHPDKRIEKVKWSSISTED
jgi:hypothetical protein